MIVHPVSQTTSDIPVIRNIWMLRNYINKIVYLFYSKRINNIVLVGSDSLNNLNKAFKEADVFGKDNPEWLIIGKVIDVEKIPIECNKRKYERFYIIRESNSIKEIFTVGGVVNYIENILETSVTSRIGEFKLIVGTRSLWDKPVI